MACRTTSFSRFSLSNFSNLLFVFYQHFFSFLTSWISFGTTLFSHLATSWLYFPCSHRTSWISSLKPFTMPISRFHLSSLFLFFFVGVQAIKELFQKTFFCHHFFCFLTSWIFFCSTKFSSLIFSNSWLYFPCSLQTSWVSSLKSFTVPINRFNLSFLLVRLCRCSCHHGILSENFLFSDLTVLILHLSYSHRYPFYSTVLFII